MGVWVPWVDSYLGTCLGKRGHANTHKPNTLEQNLAQQLPSPCTSTTQSFVSNQLAHHVLLGQVPLLDLHIFRAPRDPHPRAHHGRGAFLTKLGTRVTNTKGQLPTKSHVMSQLPWQPPKGAPHPPTPHPIGVLWVKIEGLSTSQRPK